MDKIRQREKKYQKLAKTIDHWERAKTEESAPLIEAAYQLSCQQGLLEEMERHKSNRQIRVQLEIFKKRVMDGRRAEFEKMKAVKKQIAPMIEAKKQEREAMRKKIYYLRCEEDRLKKLHEEEAERHKQLEEKERLRREAEHSKQPRPLEPAVAPRVAPYVFKHLQRETEDCPSRTSNDRSRRNDERTPFFPFDWTSSSRFSRSY